MRMGVVTGPRNPDLTAETRGAQRSRREEPNYLVLLIKIARAGSSGGPAVRPHRHGRPYRVIQCLLTPRIRTPHSALRIPHSIQSRAWTASRGMLRPSPPSAGVATRIDGGHETTGTDLGP